MGCRPRVPMVPLVVISVAAVSVEAVTEVTRALSLRDVAIGHLSPLGRQRRADPVVELRYFPGPLEFWERFGKHRIPVIFRGVQTGSDAVRLWQEDDYLADKFGDVQVLYEAKYENRSNDPRRTTFRQFLQHYKTENMYTVTQTPTQMLDQLKAPTNLACGSLAKVVEESNLWMSSGDTRSWLHHDADNLINCVVAGQKDWLFMDHDENYLRPGHARFSVYTCRTYAHMPTFTGELRYRLDFQMKAGEKSTDGSDFSDMDVDRVDLKRYPQIRDIPIQKASVGPGDCVFLPFRHVHQVRSSGRNIAVSIMFMDPEVSGVKVNDEGCPVPSMTMAGLEYGWPYTGVGPILIGYMSPHVLRLSLLRQAEITGGHLSQKSFLSMLESEITDGEDEDYMLTDEDRLQQAKKRGVELLGFTSGGMITISEIKQLPVEALRELAMLIDPPHDMVYEDPSLLGFDLAETQRDPKFVVN